MAPRDYRKIPKISPGAYIFQRPFLRGLFLEGPLFGGAYLWREIRVFSEFYGIYFRHQLLLVPNRKRYKLIYMKKMTFQSVTQTSRKRACVH